ncbi:MAG: hypothetical protein AAB215_04655 [Planctomycetota bacterium]
MANAKAWKAAEIESMVQKALAEGKTGANLLKKDEGLGYGLILTRFKARKAVPELHEAADDVYYIVKGEGEVTIGGELLEKESKGPGEWSAKGIANAQKVAVRAGDVVSIPRGTPHMMGCAGDLDYFIVKVH